MTTFLNSLSKYNSYFSLRMGKFFYFLFYFILFFFLGGGGGGGGDGIYLMRLSKTCWQCEIPHGNSLLLKINYGFREI